MGKSGSKTANTEKKVVGKRILLIDDEELVIKSVERLLAKEGYKVIVCRNGSEAIETVKKEEIDLIVCDIRMPNLSGVETIKKIREIRKQNNKEKIPEILITGYADPETNNDAEKLEVADYLYKPFDLTAFLKSVKKNIGEVG